MTVRRLVPADVPAYRSLMLEAYALHPDAFTSSVEERAAMPLSWWEARLDEREQAGSVVWGAFHEGALAGAAGLAFETREKARHKAQLFGMVVRPDCRALGFGAALVRALLDHARARDGVRLVQLTVTEGNAAAQRLYERFWLRALRIGAAGGGGRRAPCGQAAHVARSAEPSFAIDLIAVYARGTGVVGRFDLKIEA